MGTMPPAVDLTPPEELFGDADAEDPDPPVSASTPPPARKAKPKAARKAYPKRIPTPSADDPRVNAAQRAWGK